MPDSSTAPAATVSVVIAARDAAATLAAAARSALACGAVTQCVIVDDASGDGTLAAGRALAAADERVEVIARPERGGPALARNEGLGAVRGARVCFLDADDELIEGGLEALGAAMDANPDAVGALGRFRAVDRDAAAVDVGPWAADQLHGVVRRHGRLVESPEGLSAEALVTRLVSPPPGAWLLDTACLRALGGFDARTRRSEDLELLVRLASAGTLVAVERDVLRYLRHGTQRSAAVTRRQWGRGAALWRMVRNAPDVPSARRVARGAWAYHLALFESRWASPHARVRLLGLRNLAAAGLTRVAGSLGAVLPHRGLPAQPAPAPRAVD